MTNQRPKASRQAFGEALLDLGARYPKIVVLDADLSKSTKSELFAKTYPQRFFEMGIAEQNMLGVAAGLALDGKQAFCCSFACFLAGRFETIKISVAYNRANVVMVGTHAGVGIGPDGYSQMGLEDIALMRTLHGVEVFQPADEIETHAIMEYLCTRPGPAYLRLTRQDLKPIHGSDYRFAPGKLDVLRPGKDVLLFASGGPVMHALDASQRLAASGVDIGVINVPSIKPLDTQNVCQLAKDASLCVSIEDHTIMGGMGGALAEILSSQGISRLHRHGIPDVFGESGSPEDLYRKFRLDAEGIYSVVHEAMRNAQT
ncbi:MAG: transketolase family protein [Myxococcales bacterium]|nr:transketolase family protein [Myxococcales bacterium]